MIVRISQLVQLAAITTPERPARKLHGMWFDALPPLIKRKTTDMTKAEARRVIWERLATTARLDGENNDWDGYNEADAERLSVASEEIASVIDRQLNRKPRP